MKITQFYILIILLFLWSSTIHAQEKVAKPDYLSISEELFTEKTTEAAPINCCKKL